MYRLKNDCQPSRRLKYQIVFNALLVDAKFCESETEAIFKNVYKQRAIKVISYRHLAAYNLTNVFNSIQFPTS